MQLGDRELRNFVRVIMPELYKRQAIWDAWAEAAARLCTSRTTGQNSIEASQDDRSVNAH